MARLVLKLENAVLRELALSDTPVTIGRLPDNTIHLDNLAVSGHHARVIRENDDFVLYDDNSTNGTYVNGQRASRVVLSNGDTIHIGRHVLTYMEDIEAPRSEYAVLHVLSGKTDRTEYVLDADQTVIGKSDEATVRLQKWFAPKVAAIIDRRGGKYFINESASSTPVSVNSELVHEERELQAGDTIAVEDVTLAFQFTR